MKRAKHFEIIRLAAIFILLLKRKVFMEFIYQANELKSATNARKNTFLLNNGLGGYASMTSVFSAPRCDQGILVSAKKAPNVRINLVHRISEKLYCGEQEYYLSSQSFADGTPSEDGHRWLRKYAIDYTPVWEYDVDNVQVERHLCMEYGKNTAAVCYHIENNGAPEEAAEKILSIWEENK